jgi:hypothetical protein
VSGIGFSWVSWCDWRSCWCGAGTDQLIIAGSLILGFWLIGKSIYLIVN